MEGKRTGRPTRLGLLVSILVASALAPASNLAANTPFVVNTTIDYPDANPGDGICETAAGNGVCTLRAAVEEAEALPGADVITFSPSLPNPATFTLTYFHLGISTDLTITGRGSGSTIIDGNGSLTSDRVFLLANAASTFNVTMSGVTIQNGGRTLYTNAGGAILVNRTDAHLLLSDVTLTSNTAGSGGAFSSNGIVTLDHCTVSGNSATSVGGGIFNVGQLTITSSTIAGNTAATGGGLYNALVTTLVNCTVTGNAATLNYGGGLYHDAGNLNIIDTTISANHSGQNGAGIYIYPAPIPGANTLRAHNATIVDNSCVITFTGCGIYAGAGAAASIANSIIARNYQRSKVGNVADDCNSVTSLDYNLIETTSGCTIAGTTSNNIYNTDPDLGPLQDNGGPTSTHALLAGSPAIDAGNPAGCTDNLGGFGVVLTNDQRGSVRPINGRCDIGAYEYAPPVQFYTLKPCRVVDTRNADAPALVAGADRVFTLVGKCLIPSGAKGLSLNVTVASGTSLGDLRVFPAGTPLPLVSTINFAKGQTRANDALTSLSAAGAVAIRDDQAVGNSVQVILDVNGYFQ